MENVLMGLPVDGSTGSRLQIVIVCPKFLRVLSNSQGVPILATMLQPATVLAMLLGVTPQTLETHQYAGKIYKQRVFNSSLNIVVIYIYSDTYLRFKLIRSAI